MDNIPIIDMAKIADIPLDVNNNKDWKYAAGKVREALGNIGFLYLKNHGIEKSLITKAHTEMRFFFDLPLDIKLKYKKGAFEGDFNKWFGYTEAGEELLHPSSLKELRETYDYLQGIGVYPDLEVPDFNSTFNELYKCCNELAKKVIIIFAISLNLDEPKFFLNCCAHIDDLSLPRAGNMRALHYPAIPKDMHIEPGTVRLGEHSDYALLTFLFQDMIGGLEVQAVDKKWIAATPIPDTILVNTGDLLEFWTSGVFPATVTVAVICENGDFVVFRTINNSTEFPMYVPRGVALCGIGEDYTVILMDACGRPVIKKGTTQKCRHGFIIGNHHAEDGDSGGAVITNIGLVGMIVDTPSFTAQLIVQTCFRQLTMELSTKIFSQMNDVAQATRLTRLLAQIRRNINRKRTCMLQGPNIDTVVTSLKIKKTESEEKRLAAFSGRNYDNMKPVTSMEYILDRLAKSYAKSRNE